MTLEGVLVGLAVWFVASLPVSLLMARWLKSSSRSD